MECYIFYSFNKYLLKTLYVQDITLGIRYRKVKKKKYLTSKSSQYSGIIKRIIFIYSYITLHNIKTYKIMES